MNSIPQDGSVPESTDALLARFLEQHRPRLLEHARWLLRGQEHLVAAEDIVQSATLSFYQYLRNKPDAVLGNGLLALAKRCVETALNDFRKWLSPRQPLPGQKVEAMPSSHHAPMAKQPGPVTAAIEQERQNARHHAIQQAMLDLEPLDRHILQLRLEDDEQFTFARIAALVGMTEDAVRMRHRRAIDAMKPLLQTLLAGDSKLGQA